MLAILAIGSAGAMVAAMVHPVLGSIAGLGTAGVTAVVGVLTWRGIGS